jgi:hypothetical protein
MSSTVPREKAADEEGSRNCSRSSAGAKGNEPSWKALETYKEVLSNVATETDRVLAPDYPDTSRLREYHDLLKTSRPDDSSPDFLEFSIERNPSAFTGTAGEILDLLSASVKIRPPYLDFADRMPIPIEFYTIEPEVAEFCRLIRVPILQASEGCFAVLTSANPILTNHAETALLTRFLSLGAPAPVFIQTRTGIEQWKRICQRHFAS